LLVSKPDNRSYFEQGGAGGVLAERLRGFSLHFCDAFKYLIFW